MGVLVTACNGRASYTRTPNGRTMNDKSYVTMEQHLCLVCGNPYDTGAVLLDRRLRNRYNKHTLTAWGMCPEHEALRQDDYIALVGCDESKSTKQANGNLVPGGAYRTGAIAHLKRHVWENIIDVPVPEQMVCFCEEEVIQMLQGMQQASEKADE